MKAGNWLFNYVRHTRDGDRVYKEGTIDVTLRGLELKSDMKSMQILLSDEEMDELEFQLNKMKIYKRSIKK